MNRKLDFLAKYDEDLTIAQLKQAVIEDEKKATEKEQQEIQEVKKEFENTYVKYIDEHELFHNTLNVVHFKDFDRKDLNEDYTPVYTIEAEVLCFSKRDFYKKKIRKGWCDGSFSVEELKNMTKITKEEYEQYLDKYNKLTEELKEICK